ncbi:hypothetical protein [Mycobacteroides abscessus]|uniref:hypothetical protein n=1 Tax=Mycobacteroides abscessus TaxID=36809 RepID=UPI0013F64722|nr:hypothetical protein [Mycobacteroides abscessus]
MAVLAEDFGAFTGEAPVVPQAPNHHDVAAQDRHAAPRVVAAVGHCGEHPAFDEHFGECHQYRPLTARR